MCVYIGFNIVAMLAMYYWIRVKVWSTPKIFSIFKKKKEDPAPQPNIYATCEGDENCFQSAGSSSISNNEDNIPNQLQGNGAAIESTK
jgi:hypothetical protein